MHSGDHVYPECVLHVGVDCISNKHIHKEMYSLTYRHSGVLYIYRWITVCIACSNSSSSFTFVWLAYFSHRLLHIRLVPQRKIFTGCWSRMIYKPWCLFWRPTSVVKELISWYLWWWVIANSNTVGFKYFSLLFGIRKGILPAESFRKGILPAESLLHYDVWRTWQNPWWPLKISL